eukprot:COSAG02_NODE_18_length_54986_cov_345.599322_39_plen_64_part_00
MIEIRAAEALFLPRGSRSPSGAETRGNVVTQTHAAADAGRVTGSRSPSPSSKHRVRRSSTKQQ